MPMIHLGWGVGHRSDSCRVSLGKAHCLAYYWIVTEGSRICILSPWYNWTNVETGMQPEFNKAKDIWSVKRENQHCGFCVKVSTRISLSMPRKPTRTDTFRLLWIFCFGNHKSIPVSPWNGMCRSGSVCADCAGWSGSIHYAEAILFGFSRDGSYVNTLTNTVVITWVQTDQLYFLTQMFRVCIYQL